jgi:hypothetical protein
VLVRRLPLRPRSFGRSSHFSHLKPRSGKKTDSLFGTAYRAKQIDYIRGNVHGAACNCCKGAFSILQTKGAWDGVVGG